MKYNNDKKNTAAPKKYGKYLWYLWIVNWKRVHIFAWISSLRLHLKVVNL